MDRPRYHAVDLRASAAAPSRAAGLLPAALLASHRLWYLQDGAADAVVPRRSAPGWSSNFRVIDANGAATVKRGDLGSSI